MSLPVWYKRCISISYEIVFVKNAELDGVDTPTHPSEELHRKTGVEHMLTKQENYRDPEAMA